MWLATIALVLSLADVSGIARDPLRVTTGKANLLFFITTDCPISNSYAHEMARICSDYRPQGIACTLVYVDPSTTDAAAQKHAADFGHGAYPKIVDRRHDLVKATGATITPEAAVIDRSGRVVYLGRIDDSFAGLAQPRRPAQIFDLRSALDDVAAHRPVAHPRTHALGCYIADLGMMSNKP